MRWHPLSAISVVTGTDSTNIYSFLNSEKRNNSAQGFKSQSFSPSSPSLSNRVHDAELMKEEIPGMHGSSGGDHRTNGNFGFPVLKDSLVVE